MCVEILCIEEFHVGSSDDEFHWGSPLVRDVSKVVSAGGIISS